MTDLQQYLVDEFLEDYQTGEMTRRKALKMIAAVTGSVTVASGLLAACAPAAQPTASAAPTAAAGAATAAGEPTTAVAAETPTAAAAAVPDGVRVPEDDPAIEAGPVEFPAGDAAVAGYFARPVGEGPFDAVLVCHENRGLTPHIEDVTRRLAKAGYAALAVDLISREGGTASKTEEEIPGILGNVDPARFTGDFASAWEHLKAQPFVAPGGVGMVGFCFGGGVTWRAATAMPEMQAAVPFYGPPPAVEDVPKIQAAVLAIYGGEDERINASIPAIEAAMAANGKVYEKMIYPGAGHAFHNDMGTRYNPEAATDAWARTLAWFKAHLNAA